MGNTINVKGNAKSVTLNRKATVNLTSGSTVNKIDVTVEATGSSVKNEGNIVEFEANAQVEVTGAANIKKATIKSDNVTLGEKPKDISVEGENKVTIGDDEPINQQGLDQEDLDEYIKTSFDESKESMPANVTEPVLNTYDDIFNLSYTETFEGVKIGKPQTPITKETTIDRISGTSAMVDMRAEIIKMSLAGTSVSEIAGVNVPEEPSIPNMGSFMIGVRDNLKTLIKNAREVVVDEELLTVNTTVGDLDGKSITFNTVVNKGKATSTVKTTITYSTTGLSN